MGNIRKITSKQAKIQRKYAKLRKKILTENPLCLINLPGCTRRATELHHSAKKFSEEMWLDERFLLPSCNHCHRILEMNPSLAKKLGFYNYKA